MRFFMRWKRGGATFNLQKHSKKLNKYEDGMFGVFKYVMSNKNIAFGVVQTTDWVKVLIGESYWLIVFPFLKVLRTFMCDYVLMVVFRNSVKVFFLKLRRRRFCLCCCMCLSTVRRSFCSTRNVLKIKLFVTYQVENRKWRVPLGNHTNVLSIYIHLKQNKQ